MKFLQAVIDSILSRRPSVESLEVPVKKGEGGLGGDRRRRRRVSSPTEAWYRTDSMPFNRSQVVEYSVDGARMLVHRDVNVGDRLEVTLKTNGGRYVTALSRVVWAEPLPGGVRKMAGLALDVHASDRQAMLT